MGSFIWGLLIGELSGLVLAALIGVWAYKRMVALERRQRESARLAELGTLTGGLAHEIKNPLSTVQLNLQLLQEDLNPHDPSHSRIVNRLLTVRNETGRLREILDDFLRYAGRLEVQRKPIELNGMLDELVDFFAPQAQSQRIQIRLKKSPIPVTAAVDPRLIKQAMLNLMINAVHAMPQGGELILTIDADPVYAIIDVIDTGPGIPPEALDKIFEAYYSTKKGGTGLGLPMAKRIAEAHGGRLSIKSEAGKGSDFTLRLPLAT